MTAPGSGWDDAADVAVVGYGAAGAVAAIEAHDAGAEVLLLEKMPHPGGLSIVSAGGIRVAMDAERAFEYLQATCGGRTPLPVLRALADGMVRIPEYLASLARGSGATVTTTPALGNYPFPGTESLAYCEVARAPELDNATEYHAVPGIRGGCKLFSVLEHNVLSRGIRLVMPAAAERLIAGENGEVQGVSVRIGGRVRRIKARRAVILACGGFEHDEEMKRQYLQAMPVLTGAYRGNTGDGIRMAQGVGAALWHMWHYHGGYGLKHSDPAYPFGFPIKLLPIWTPERPGSDSYLGVPEPATAGKGAVPVAWIVVDQSGQRFMDEYPPYPSDTGVRPFDWFDSKVQRFPRIPGFVVFDEDGRRMYPIARSVQNDPEYRYAWSADNLKEVDNGILERAESLAALAVKMGVEPAALEASVARWNRFVALGRDEDFGRRADTLVPIRTAPFYFGRAYPVVTNTQGGPEHDTLQRVLNPFGEPIARLYAAGEMGSVFGHLYMSGGNLAECFVGGWTAARHAAGLRNWDG
ncbi:MAG: FAD-binding protein [Burkholderiales bacterium]|nr:FAD-binding protein [Burkholderiales bacterium]